MTSLLKLSSLWRRLAVLLVGCGCLGFWISSSEAAPRFRAVAFDYFVIFNPNSVVPEVEKVFPGKKDFYEVTEDVLVYTAQAMKLELTPENKEKLMGAYLKLKPWPDSVAALRSLKQAGVRLIILLGQPPTPSRRAFGSPTGWNVG